MPLPAEIAIFVARECGEASLFSLSQVNLVWQEAAERCIYHRIGGLRFQKLRSCIDTIAGRPHLGLYVRQIDLDLPSVHDITSIRLKGLLAATKNLRELHLPLLPSIPIIHVLPFDATYPHLHSISCWIDMVTLDEGPFIAWLNKHTSLRQVCLETARVLEPYLFAPPELLICLPNLIQLTTAPPVTPYLDPSLPLFHIGIGIWHKHNIKCVRQPFESAVDVYINFFGDALPWELQTLLGTFPSARRLLLRCGDTDGTLGVNHEIFESRIQLIGDQLQFMPRLIRVDILIPSQNHDLSEETITRLFGNHPTLRLMAVLPVQPRSDPSSDQEHLWIRRTHSPAVRYDQLFEIQSSITDLSERQSFAQDIADAAAKQIELGLMIEQHNHSLRSVGGS